jgi:hypothetical protein
MKRPVLRFVAVIGAATVSALAVSPAFAAAGTSRASAQSIDLHLGGQSLIAQKQTATNDGTTETRNDTDTIPQLVGTLPDNSALSAAVLPQLARALSDGTSYACAGLASEGSGGGNGNVVDVGQKSCTLKGDTAVTLNLGTLDLGEIVVDEGALAALGQILNPVGGGVNPLVQQIADALNGTPLGEMGLEGNLGVVAAVCQANPDAATGNATLADSRIQLTLPGDQEATLVNLPVNPAENQKVVGDTVGSTTLITTALSTYLKNFLQGQLAPVAVVPAQVQQQILNVILPQLKPLTDAVAQYLAEITLRETVHADNGRSIDVTALHAEVLPAVKEQVGEALVDGRIGRVTCGPNARIAPNNEAGSPNQPKLPDIPTVVDSGTPGHADHTAEYVLGATAALLLLAGTAGLAGYRRMLHK